MDGFFQSGPSLGNPFAADPLLQAYLRWRLPSDLQETLAPGLLAFGQLMTDEVQRLGPEAEAHPPRLIPFTPWGERIDQIEVSGAWKRLQDIAACEGLVALGHERREGSFSRLHQFARLYLFHPDSAWFTCPLAMTDGAARAIAEHGDEALKERALPHLLSRDPEEFWTSGQWMTERAGGSDVGRTETVARRHGGSWSLHGVKWFTSAATSPMALTLARIEGAPAGSAGLSLFYVELADETGRLRNIRVQRLKDKLGSRALPTAELELAGTPAILVGEKGHGVRKMASLFNLTRLHNSVCAASALRRALALAKDYAGRREAFGKTLLAHPGHAETLAALQVEWEGTFHLAFHLAYLLGRLENGEAGAADAALLRLLTPVSKLFTAKAASAGVTEAMEAMGGAGYVEDTGFPALVRNTLVLPIWEGTTNVLALDVLRAIGKDGAFEPYCEDVSARLRKAKSEPLAESARRVRKALEALQEGRKRLDDSEAGSALARAFAFGLARTYIGSLLLEFAAWMAADGLPAANPGRLRAVQVAQRWCRAPLAELPEGDAAHRRVSLEILGESP
jgi:alkylation response protein AidB-like acyl-CoA dehydrogenase